MEVFFPGQRLAERYVLAAPIGSGGMSHVWRAVDEVLGRPVAVKTLDAALHADPDLCTAIRREARAAASITHPHITQVYDFGEQPLPDGGVAPYLVMELLVGQNLAVRLSHGPLPWQEAVAVCAGVAGALGAAHRLGVVHRDIKPANVMLTSAGAKVVDFGIAAVTAGPDSDGEAPRAGTPAYLAPEVLTGGTGTTESDVYALGALLHTALTAATPFAVNTWAEATLAHERGAMPAPILVRDLPHEVRELCARCLSPSPWSRPTSDEAAEVLARWCAPVSPAAGFTGLPATGYSPQAAPAATPAAAAVPTPAASAAPVGSHPTLLDASLAAGLASAVDGDPAAAHAVAPARPAAAGSGAMRGAASARSAVPVGRAQPVAAAPTPARRASGTAGAGRRRPRRRSGFAALGTGLALVGLILVSVAAGLLTPDGLQLGIFSRQPQASVAPAKVAPDPTGVPTPAQAAPDPTPQDPSTPAAAMTAIESEVATALNDGRIDAGTASDLADDIQTMRDRYNSGRRSDIQRRAQDVQRKLDAQVGQGGLDVTVGAQLSHLLDVLIRLARNTSN